MWISNTATAHEFWLQAKDWQVPIEEQIEADIRVGQKFKGATYSYFPNGFRRFELAQGETVEPVPGRAGDIPAVHVAPVGEGLNVLVHETTDFVLTYSDWALFTNFVEHKDFEGALERHVERGLPQTGFKEAYSRYAKALIAVGDGQGRDREFGLETEFVALANPYTDSVEDGFPVRLFYQGAPRGNVQVELFDKDADGHVEVTLHKTGDDGVARLPVRSGHVYMVDAVVLREPSAELAEKRGAVWESLWANLSFAVP
ncbi:MAG: DUF4198 domain-containing protein [Brevirhabdus sp.]